MSTIKELISGVKSGDFRSLARAISIVENDLSGCEEILESLSQTNTPVIGITGPPGAGKSTLVNALIDHLNSKNKKLAVIAVDPSSPFNHGSLLGDRIRMSEHFTNPNIFIRSLATRGSLGGLSAKIIEISDLVKNACFDYIIVETVGVGQSEIEIAGLADTSVLVLVPEGGDDIQSIKSGIMEIADIFVLNKSDRPGASLFFKNLHDLLHERDDKGWTPKITKTVASKNEGIEELMALIHLHQQSATNTKKSFLLAEKAYQLIVSKRMKDVSKKELKAEIEKLSGDSGFNLYAFVNSYK